MLRQKDGELSTYFDKSDKTHETREAFVNTLLQQLRHNNHTSDDNKGKTKGHLTLEQFFVFIGFF